MTRPPPFAGVLVLVVEDNPVNLRMLTLMLARLGCTVEVATRGQQAVDQVAARGSDPYHLVLMDCHMPGLDGWGAARAISALPQGQELVLVGITADALPGTRARCLEAGMNECLTKPLPFSLLEETVGRWHRRPSGGSGSAP